MTEKGRWIRLLSDEEFARLWNCRRITTEQIARACGVTRTAVHHRAKRLGLPSRARNRARKIDDARFRELWLAGVAVAEIEREFGIAHSSATAAARRLGLPLRRRSNGGGNRGGWQPTISVEEWRQMRIAEAMAADAAATAERLRAEKMRRSLR